jgi:uncharacterized membrane protein required for colicin V production
MEMLQRLQPLDILFAVLWAAIVGWGLRTGTIRQAGMLLGVYGAAIVAGSLYHQTADVLALAFGRESLAQIEFYAYVALFIATLGIITLVVGRAYPGTRITRHFGTDNVVGLIVAAVWGIMLLIAVLTMLRYFAVVPSWRDQELAQQAVLRQIQLSQVAPVLAVAAAPLWQAMVPWFPTQVSPQL